MFLNVNNDKDISEVLNIINDALLESIYGKSICVKGAYRLNQILSDYKVDPDFIRRPTSDLDIDSSDPEVKVWLPHYISNIFKNYKYSCIVDVKPHSSGSITIRLQFEGLNKTFNVKLDVNFREYIPNSQYSIFEILRDKLISLSNKTIFRRAKDIFDVYIIIFYLEPGILIRDFNIIANLIKNDSKNFYGTGEYLLNPNYYTDILHALDSYDPNPITGVLIEDILDEVIKEFSIFNEKMLKYL